MHLACEMISNWQVVAQVKQFKQSKEVSLKKKKTLMDELAFKAHFRFVRGWPDTAINQKWAEIERAPQRFDTEVKQGITRVWVPKDPTAALTEIVSTEDMSMSTGEMAAGIEGALPSSIEGGQDSLLHMPLVPEAKRMLDNKQAVEAVSEEQAPQPVLTPVKVMSSKASSLSDTTLHAWPHEHAEAKGLEASTEKTVRKAEETEEPCKKRQKTISGKEPLSEILDNTEISKPLVLDAYKKLLEAWITGKAASLKVVTQKKIAYLINLALLN